LLAPTPPPPFPPLIPPLSPPSCWTWVRSNVAYADGGILRNLC
jgi:hypothetical protein